jgi:hypothetical protein
MKTKLIILGFLVLACSCSENFQLETNTSELNVNSKNLVGNWNIYTTKKGNGNKDCGNHPCGIVSYAEIFLDKEKLKGKMSVGYNSMASPPGITNWAEIVIQSSSKTFETFTMTHQTTMGCDEKYTIQEVNEGRFSGTFEANDCKIDGKLYKYEGDFTAIKLKDENK